MTITLFLLHFRLNRFCFCLCLKIRISSSTWSHRRARRMERISYIWCKETSSIDRFTFITTCQVVHRNGRRIDGLRLHGKLQVKISEKFYLQYIITPIWSIYDKIQFIWVIVLHRPLSQNIKNGIEDVFKHNIDLRVPHKYRTLGAFPLTYCHERQRNQRFYI